MQYLGGKAKSAKAISQWVNEFREPGQPYLEPFVGGGWILERVYGPGRTASDVVPDLILLYRALQDGWDPPSEISRELYEKLRTEPSSALRGFAGFSMGFGGKFFGTYAWNRRGNNYAAQARRAILRQAKRFPASEVRFLCCDYREHRPEGSLVYCDPPYAGTTDYGFDFDSGEFWETVRSWAKRNTVLVSEYNAPDFCQLLQEFRSKSTLNYVPGREERPPTVDKLWRVRA
jgi:DNA adenine methylase